MTRQVLIVYGSRYGQTAKIAAYLRAVLAADGLSVTMVDADAVGRSLELANFDAIIVGSSVIRRKHRKSVAAFVRQHLDALNALPSAFFSVSGSAASANPRERAEARALMEGFLTTAGWNPDLLTTLGGAFAYTRYSPILRWVMKRIALKEGGPTDTTCDHELTDWEQVEDFGHRFARVAAPATHSVAPSPVLVSS